MKREETGAMISFRWYLIGVIFLIILVVSVLVFNFNYQSSRLNLESGMLSQQEKSEFSLIQSMVLVDQGLVIFDRSLDYRLKGPMDVFLTAYEESGGDPSAIDLEALKVSFGDGYELYIINEAGFVEHTTYAPDLSLDFSQFPQFMERLTGIREGNIFVADRITQEFRTGLWRKYVYHPTPDHRYILEISYMDAEIQEIRSTLRFTEAVEKIRLMNPYLTSIRIFNWVGDEVGNSSYIPEESRTAIIMEVLESGRDYTFQDPDSGLITRYLMIDLSAHDNPPEMNLVAELTYSEEPIRDQLTLILLNHLIIAVIAVMTGGILAFLITALINRPILQIVEDTRAIASGELDHPIQVSGLPEFHSLSVSIQLMVDRMKDMMTHLQASEEELLQQNEELEERVKERTVDLEAALLQQRIAEERFKTLFREMLDGFVQNEIIVDDEGRAVAFRIIAVNPAFERMVGISADDLDGQMILDIVPELRADLFQQVAETGVPAIFENCLSDNEKCFKISVFRPETGQLACIFEDISEERRIGEEIRRSLMEKEVLIKEIHHRVKNNMQVVSGLLMLQRKSIQDEAIRKIFQESESRVFTIALVHEKLYESRSLSRIEYGQYLSTMGDYILSLGGVGPGTVSLGIDAPDIYLSIDKAVPLSLITNELLTNSLKHAFPDGRKGKITIRMRREGGTIVYRFSDDGVGLPEGFDFSGTASLGMQLINSLVLQLMGRITMIRDAKTTFEIVFPIEPDGEDRNA